MHILTLFRCWLGNRAVEIEKVIQMSRLAGKFHYTAAGIGCKPFNQAVISYDLERSRHKHQ